MARTSVFVVDDHTLVRQGLIQLLGMHSEIQIVGEAANGREALSKIPLAKPDIVLLDISMPELDGINIIGRLKKLWPDGKIIILTMHDNSHYVVDALRNGASAYLLKDLTDQELVTVINTVRDGQIYLSSKLNQLVIRKYVALMQENSLSTPLDILTEREREVFQLVVEGYTTKEISAKLNIAPKTTEHHRKKVLEKLSLKNTSQLMRYAAKEGYIT